MKKFERLAGIKALELQRERVILDGENLENATFLVSHAASTWSDLVLELIRLAQTIHPVWRFQLRSELLAGTVDPYMENPNVECRMPIFGLRELKWEINPAEKYRRVTWLGGQPNQW